MNAKIYIWFLVIFLFNGCLSVPQKVSSDETAAQVIDLKLYIAHKDCYNYLLDMKFDGFPLLAKLDTGSVATIVPKNDFFNRYTPVRVESFTGSAHTIVKVPMIKIENIQIADFSINLKEVVRNPVARAPPTLGVNALSSQPFGFDFPHQHLLLNPKFPQEKLRDLNVAKDGRLLVDLEFDGAHYPSLIDTGYCYTSVDASVILQHPDIFVYEKDQSTVDLTGHTVKNRMFRMKTLKFSEFKLSNALVVENDLSDISKALGHPIVFILGSDHMSMAKWYFDIKNKKWAATR
jgi:hypothetical protein